MPTQARRSYSDVEKEHFEALRAGSKIPTKREKLVKAFQKIVDLKPDDLNSFFVIGWLPWGAVSWCWSNGTWWGGYCYHGQILFPTWHRAYVKRIEDALQIASNDGTVMLPYLDWCSPDVLKSGLPATLTSSTFPLSMTNLLQTHSSRTKFQKGIFDNVIADHSKSAWEYSKPAEYNTVRFPLSGLVGTKDIAATQKHNSQFTPEQCVKLLNENVVEWLNRKVTFDNGKTNGIGTFKRFESCLKAPNYTVFSNTSSALQWNQELLNSEDPDEKSSEFVVPLESPHSNMHLCVGGYEPANKKHSFDTVTGANGDMGENDTAAFDPIFFLHHCFIDRMFWLWQVKHDSTSDLSIIPQYPGTYNFDNQGPTPGKPAGIWLDLDTTLDPFLSADGKQLLTSRGVINIEKQLNYTYSGGSFQDDLQSPSFGEEPIVATSSILVNGPSRAKISGSFILSTWGTFNNERQMIHSDSILSRRQVSGCANCQNHLTVKTVVRLPTLKSSKDVETAQISTWIHTHDAPKGEKLTDFSDVAGFVAHPQSPLLV